MRKRTHTVTHLVPTQRGSLGNDAAVARGILIFGIRPLSHNRGGESTPWVEDLGLFVLASMIALSRKSHEMKRAHN